MPPAAEPWQERDLCEGTLDSRGFFHLRPNDLDGANADFDAALRTKPKAASALYGRGIAKLKKGDTEGGNADIAAAKAIVPDVAKQMERYGVPPL